MKKGDVVWRIGGEDDEHNDESEFGLVTCVTNDWVRYTSLDSASLEVNSWVFDYRWPEVARRFRRAIVSFVGPVCVEVDDAEDG